MTLYEYDIFDRLIKIEQGDDVVDLVPGVTGVGETAKAVGAANKIANATDTAKDAAKVTRRIGEAVTETSQVTYRAFTRRNLRENLKRLTGSDGIGMQAHHVLPVKFENWFNSRGIECIHEPKFGSWVDTNAHSSWSYAYNKSWDDFRISNPNASKNEILNFAKELAKEYGFSINF